MGWVGQKDGKGWVLVWTLVIDGYLPFEQAAFVYKTNFLFRLHQLN
jgi:hypothetical protein